MTDSLDSILRERLGPDPADLLQQLLDGVAAGKIIAVAVVAQSPSDRMSVYSAGCTVLETVGMLAWAGGYAQGAINTPELDELEPPEGG